MTKTYKIRYDWWVATFEIKDDSDTIKNMESALLYSAGGEIAIKEANGDITKAFLNMIKIPLLMESINWNLEGVLSEFDNKEYWFSLRGKYGVKLCNIESWEFFDSNFEVYQVDESSGNFK